MNHIHGTRRLSVTVAALAVPGFQGTATAAVHGPQHHRAAGSDNGRSRGLVAPVMVWGCDERIFHDLFRCGAGLRSR